MAQVASEFYIISQNKQPLRLFGLSLGNLSPALSWCRGLFESKLNADYKSIDRLMDEIRERFGPGAINRANLLPNNDVK